MRWLLLFLCLSASAQPFNAVTGLPFLAPNAIASSGADGALPSGIAHRLKSSDITVGAGNSLTNWVDEIQGSTWVPYTNAAAAAIWDTNGVNFYGTNRMINSNAFAVVLSAGGSDAFLVIHKLRTTSGAQSIFVIYNAGGQQLLEQVSGNYYDSRLGQVVPSHTTTTDFLFAGKDGSAHPNYTNGVLAATSGTAWGLQTVYNMGAGADGPPFYTAPLKEPYNGSIKEVIHWTNVVGFTTTQVSNIHYYATNTYNYSP